MSATFENFVCETGAPRRARSWVRERLEAWTLTEASDGDLLRDALLCVSELVTNAYQAGCRTITLSCALRPPVLRLSLIDDAPGSPVASESPSPHSSRGRGLYLISRLATHWGVDAAAGGKEVWLELAAPG